ncbi:YqgE/AlgH family protein [Neomegalonema sp.]|uniref:YqgE/AlgH family protein n=1 Tax=Neomegalonema sp. TaxID=2039713 RepID=UPI00261C03AD|nr:YqgE/AlgH family protein [Neomegalonema sp.]MDD2868231.1 YqgE/AlgH family protein [Neomegalonema sp.]
MILQESFAEGLKGRFLIADPSIGDPEFARTLILVTAHGPQGAMGFIVNRPAERPRFAEVRRELGLGRRGPTPDPLVMSGGPVEETRGFLIHSEDYDAPQDSSENVGPGLRVTSAMEALRAVAAGSGPRRALFVLGYAGWAPRQLERELQRNDWLVGPAAADPELVFATPPAERWTRALESLGVAPDRLMGGGTG